MGFLWQYLSLKGSKVSDTALFSLFPMSVEMCVCGEERTCVLGGACAKALSCSVLLYLRVLNISGNWVGLN